MIRIATSADLPRIVDIYNAAIPGRLATADTEPVSLMSRRPWFEAHGSRRPLWVEDREGLVLGWATLSDFHPRPAYHPTAELSVYVAPESHRCGIGRALVSHAIQCASCCGLSTLIGLVFGHNAPSLALLEGFGFQRWGRLPCVALLDGEERDLVLLGQRLHPAPSR